MTASRANNGIGGLENGSKKTSFLPHFDLFFGRVSQN
jgi:hypothetical protein